ncbi:MAG TPA: Ig-like domain-containing protein [Gemmatimonadaceae bacterium]|nr:Ig-like domain-containing protein [Gemmatimonadaceae bacterium]
MLLSHLAILALLQQTATAAGAVLPPSPIARVTVTPAVRTVTIGDSVRLKAAALDSSGKPVEGAVIRFTAENFLHAGTVDSGGLVVAGSTGKLPINVMAMVPGTRPVVQQIALVMVPAPASRVSIGTPVGKLVVGQTMRLSALAFAANNDRARDPISWSSSARGVLSVDGDGVATAVAPGRATLTAKAGSATATLPVQVVANTIASLALAPDKPHARQGDMIRFEVKAKDKSGAAITGLTPSWTFSPGNGVLGSDGGFVGYVPGDYVVTASLGTRSASTVVHLAARDVRRPVTVVGRLPRTAFPTSEVWIHPNGKVAYLGTHGGGDRVYAIDISDPAHPVVVDSIQANTRLVNDMMTTPDGKYMVFTREGASDRKNGIVIASVEDPLHPKAIAEFTDGVTAGVHSAYVYSQEKYGTHVYLTNDGTGALHIIDINDPYHPKQVSTFRVNSPDAGRYLHDVDVRGGFLYASYWNDGLVILDIGNGLKGGSPSNPKLVSQFKYDLDSLYSDVEAVSGPGFTRGTHTAWRHGNYVFIADEVYRNEPVHGASDASSDRMYGTLQVIDVTDIEHPKSVAWYTPENGGVHNVWVVGDTLYLGAYDAGFHVFDISGELRGDLREQGREIASLNTADMQGFVKNAAFTWGVVVNPKDGLAYVNDYNNGLWVVRVDPRPPLVP